MEAVGKSVCRAETIATYRCKALSSVVRHSCKCCPGCRPRRTNLGPRQTSEPQGWGPRSGPHQSVVSLHSQVLMSLFAQSAGWWRHLGSTVINSSTARGCFQSARSLTARQKDFKKSFFDSSRFLQSMQINTFVTLCLPLFIDQFGLWKWKEPKLFYEEVWILQLSTCNKARGLSI